MNVGGLGLVCAAGAGAGAWAAAMREGRVPAAGAAPAGPAAGLPVLRAPAELSADAKLAARLRRLDRFGRLAVVAAAEALAGAPPVDGTRVGLVLTTAFGPHATVFRFLDEVLDFGDAKVSPTLFSQTVHGAAAASVAMAFGLRGPCATVTRLSFAFHEGLRLASAWLASGRCDRVLLGAADELDAVLEHVCARELRPAPGGLLRPFRLERDPGVVPGEGAVFFRLEPAAGRGGVRIGLAGGGAGGAPDVLLLESGALARDETPYRAVAAGPTPVAACAPLFGSLKDSTAFQAAAAVALLRDGAAGPAPGAGDNPLGLRIASAEELRRARRIRVVGFDCAGGSREIEVATAEAAG